MTIVFEAYSENSATIEVSRIRRVRLVDVPNTIIVRFENIAHITGHAVNDSSFNLHRVAKIRLSDAGENLFYLNRQPVAFLAAALPLPTANVFVLSSPGRGLVMQGNLINDSKFDLTRPSAIRLTNAAGLLLLNYQPAVYLSDGIPHMDRTGLLLQQPMLVSNLEEGITVGLSDGFAGYEAVTLDAIQALLDLFTASDTYARQAQVLAALVDGLSLSDVAQMIWQADLLDSFIASAVGNGMAQLTVMLSETIDFSDGASALSTVLAAIRDGFYVTLTLRDGDDVYTAWVMTPENRAMRSYSSWPFNSIATIGGRLFGAADDGLYLLGGDTDAGQAILASIRTGRLSLGNTRLKRIDRAYIGANTAGNLLLKVEATTIAGDRLQQVYRMTPAVTDEPREHRVDVGRGFRSVYWTFELANDTDGADFELHDMQVLPLTLSGRTF